MGQRGRPRHPDVLTPREQEVLGLVREGLTNEQIAERLGVSFETAKAHVGSILSKLNVLTREEAAAWHAPERERPAWLFLGAMAVALACAVLAFVAILAFGWLKTGDGDALVIAPTDAARPTESLTSATSTPVAAGITGSTSAPVQSPTPTETQSPTPTSTFVPEEPGRFPVTNRDVHIANSDGSYDRFFAHGGSPLWSPDGTLIAYDGYSTGPNLGGRDWLVAASPNGGPETKLGFYDWSDVGELCGFTGWSWSPDGGEFYYWDPGRFGNGASKYNIAGRSQTPVDACDGTWLPDGRMLVTTKCIDPSNRWCIDMVSNGSSAELTVGQLQSVSHNGNLLAFIRNGGLFLRDLSNGYEREMVHSADGPGNVTWSPDDSLILFSSSSQRVKSLDVQSGQIVDLFRGYVPRWSPDGAHIAFATNRSDGSCPGTVIADSTDFHQIIFIPYASELDWSPDGTQFAYTILTTSNPVFNC